MNKNRPETLSVIELAQQIRQRPGMYFGDKITLTGLQNLLFGFSLNSKLKSNPPFEYFNRWTNQKLGIEGSAQHWSWTIMNSCGNDELKAFWKFYELLDEFVLIRPLEIHETYLTIENFSSYYSTEKERPHRYIDNDLKKSVVEPAPYHIKSVDFGHCVFVYFYDFNYVVGDTKIGMYYKDFDNMNDCKQQFNEVFGQLKWAKINKDNINEEFAKITTNS